jgi:hypothetical protein
MKKLYKPENEIELSLIKSIFESESIQYFVHNDHFGSLKIGPQIDLFNTKMVMVPEEQYAKASELLNDYLGNIQKEQTEVFQSEYSLMDKFRMLIEAVVFGWFIPGKKRRK